MSTPGDDYIYSRNDFAEVLSGGGGDDGIWTDGVELSIDGGTGNDFIYLFHVHSSDLVVEDGYVANYDIKETVDGWVITYLPSGYVLTAKNIEYFETAGFWLCEWRNSTSAGT